MPRFPDAIGYLLETRDTVREAWFHALCDMAIASTGERTHHEQLDSLWGLFHGDTQYTPAAATVPASPTNATTPPPAYLEELSDFSPFKKLQQGLAVRFDRQLTVIFGKNGSGKSSICQALKVLANPETPPDPLHDVRATPTGTPSFSYKFRDQAEMVTWTPTSGFGMLSPSIKYFDSTVAIKHTTGSLQPQEAIEIAPFRLDVFEYAGQLVAEFQTSALARASDEARCVQVDIDTVKQRISGAVDINAAPFDRWTATNSDAFARYMTDLPAFDEAKASRLAECTRLQGQYSAASSEEGLRALQAQHSLLEQFALQLESLAEWCAAASLAELQAAESQGSQKRTASAEEI